MNVSTQQYLLSCQASQSPDCGQWRFVLRAADGSDVFEASDTEPSVHGERLDLLTVVRALESLDQPSLVTLVNCSSYVRRGMQYGLPEWRENGWRWEFFGQMVPVKNHDLWQRLDRVMRFHQVDCRHRRFDPPHDIPAPTVRGARHNEIEHRSGRAPVRPSVARRLTHRVASMAAGYRRRAEAIVRLWRRRVAGVRRVVMSWPMGRAGHRGSASG